MFTNEYEIFLKKLKKARLEANLTQVEVSRILECHQSYISKSESGERRVDFVELVRFSKIYKKPLDYFKG